MHLLVKVHTDTQKEVRVQTQSQKTSFPFSLFHADDKPFQSINIFTLQAFTFKLNHLSLHLLSVFLYFFVYPPLPFIVHFVKRTRRLLPTVLLIYSIYLNISHSIIVLHHNFSLKTKCNAFQIESTAKVQVRQNRLIQIQQLII